MAISDKIARKSRGFDVKAKCSDNGFPSTTKGSKYTNNGGDSNVDDNSSDK